MTNMFEKNIPYIVTIKEKELYKYINTTVSSGYFCGYLVNHGNGCFYFELNGRKMLVICKEGDIECMAPSKRHVELYRQNNKN